MSQNLTFNKIAVSQETHFQLNIALENEQHFSVSQADTIILGSSNSSTETIESGIYNGYSSNTRHFQKIFQTKIKF